MSRYHQGKFTPQNPAKYAGDVTDIVYRSSWEFSFMRWADSNPSVLTWASECIHIPYYLATDGKWHRYFPDFLLKIKSSDGTPKTWLVEIKPESQTRHPQTKRYGSSRRHLKESMEYAKNQAKWEAATIYCNDKGWKFMILTERDLFQKLPNGK